MAEVGGMLASGVLQMVAGQIGSAIGDQITLQWNFNDDLQGMKMTLESVQEVLKDAERQSTTNGEVRLWLKRLKNSMYDISDMIDEYEANAKPPARKVCMQRALHKTQFLLLLLLAVKLDLICFLGNEKKKTGFECNVLVEQRTYLISVWG